ERMSPRAGFGRPRRQSRPGLQVGIARDASSSCFSEHEPEEDDADDAVHGEERSVQPPKIAWTNQRVLVGEQHRDRGNAEPVERAEMEPEANRGEQGNRGRVGKARPPEETPLAESRRERVQPLLAIDLEIEQRVEEVEARHPERDCATERPRWPRQPSGDRDPGADRREAVDGPEPEMREPGPAL